MYMRHVMRTRILSIRARLASVTWDLLGSPWPGTTTRKDGSGLKLVGNEWHEAAAPTPLALRRTAALADGIAENKDRIR